VTISIPISDGIDPTTVIGASYYDTGQGVWILVPGSVDITKGTIEVSTTHLSLWTTFGFSSEMPVDNVNFGWFSLTRPDAGLTYSGPDASYSGAWTSHGICVRAATFTDTNEADYWGRADNLTFSIGNYWGAPYADDREPFALYRVPTGTYQITEYNGQSEVNPGNPMYIPHFFEQWRNLGTITVAGGQTVPFTDANASYNAQGWTLGRPPCWGEVTTSVQTGGEAGVQVTLNWNSNADLDLHVIEPDGTEIYYNNPISSSGGALDRDNQCDSDFVLGRPENIFWTTPPNGTYQVNVVYYQDCGDAGPVNFTVRVCIKGSCGSPIGNIVNTDGDTVQATFFTLP
jgi:hypothetical protein